MRFFFSSILIIENSGDISYQSIDSGFLNELLYERLSWDWQFNLKYFLSFTFVKFYALLLFDYCSNFVMLYA